MKVLFSFLLVATLHICYGQPTEDKINSTKEISLKNSQKLMTWSKISATTGSVLFVIGCVMYMSEMGNGWDPGSEYNRNISKTGETLMVAGGGLVLVGVPLRYSAKKNEKKAASLSLKYRPTGFLDQRDSRFSSALVFYLCIKFSGSKKVAGSWN